jgi:hydrogenase maturation protease
VARRLARRPRPEGVRVVDFGIRGLDLTYALLDPYEAVVLVDAAPRGERPGTLYVLEPDAGGAPGPGANGLLLQTHGMDPVRVLRLAAAQGSPVRRILLVGCEPGPVDEEEMELGMSDPVRAAVDEAVVLVESLVARLLAGEPAAPAVNLSNAPGTGNLEEACTSCRLP